MVIALQRSENRAILQKMPDGPDTKFIDRTRAGVLNFYLAYAFLSGILPLFSQQFTL
jgi:hypothetical protein